MNYFLLRNTAAAAVVLFGAALLLFFTARHVQLIPGLVLLWGELIVAFSANRVAHVLTKRAIALKGIEAEQNPAARKMYATGSFTRLYLAYGLVFASGVVLTVISVDIGAVWLGMLVIVLCFPVVGISDLLNDYHRVRRYEREAALGHGGSTPAHLAEVGSDQGAG